MKKIPCIFIAFLSLLLFLTFPPKSVQAQEISLGVYPPIIEVTAEPGSVINESITVYAGAGDLVTLDAEYFTPKDEQGNIQTYVDNPYFQMPDYCVEALESPPNEGETRRECEQIALLNSPLRWLDFREKQFILLKTSEQKNSTSKQVDFRMRIPQDAPLGDYYITIFATNHGKAEGVVKGYTQHAGKVGVNLIVTVQKEGETLEPKAEILDFSIPFIVTSTPFNFSAKVANRGNVRFKTFRNVEVYNLQGTKVASTELLPVNVLKGSTRILQTSVNPAVPRLDEDSRLVVVDPLENKNVLGSAVTKVSPNLYTAYLNLFPDNEGEEPLTAKATFLYLPKEFIFIFFGVVGLAGALIYRRRGKKVKRLD